MKRVYKTKTDEKGKNADDTTSQAVLRKLLHEQPVKFLDRLHKAEMDWGRMRAEAAARRKAEKGGDGKKAGAPAEPDVGEAKCLELLEGLLRERGWEG